MTPKHLKWQPPPRLTHLLRTTGAAAAGLEGPSSRASKNTASATPAQTPSPRRDDCDRGGCESYGCEPVFALAYIRHVNDHGQDLQLTYASPLFEQALIEAGMDEQARERFTLR